MAEKLKLDLVEQNSRERMLTKIQQKQGEEQQRQLEAKKTAELKKIEEQKLAIERKFENIRNNFCSHFFEIFEQHLNIRKSDIKDFSKDELLEVNQLLTKRVNDHLAYKLVPASIVSAVSLGLFTVGGGFSLIFYFWPIGLLTGMLVALGTLFNMLIVDSADDLLIVKLINKLSEKIDNDKTTHSLIYWYRARKLKKHYGENYFPLKEIKERIEYVTKHGHW